MAPLMAADGSLLVRPSGGIIATTCSSPAFDCDSPSFYGCASCSCCGAERYNVCIDGATGDAAAANGSWILQGGQCGSSYSKTSGSVSLSLNLSSEGHDWFGNVIDVGCRNWHLQVTANGQTVIDESGNYDDWTEMGSTSCAAGGSTPEGVGFSFRPATIWSPPKVRLTFSGNTPCSGCTGAHPYNYFSYSVNSVSLDGVYELPLDYVDQWGSCEYGPITAGSYSIKIWSGQGCTGSSYTQTGQFIIKAWITPNGFGASAFQNNCPHSVPGADFQGNLYPDEQPPICCTSQGVSGITNNDDRCPLAWGYYNTAYGRACAHGTASLVGVYT